MNPELNKTVMEMIKIESMKLMNDYCWAWDDHAEQMLNENGESVSEVAYDCEGYLINPKVLATYIEDYIRFGKHMNWNYDLK